jgi:putative redox protein
LIRIEVERVGTGYGFNARDAYGHTINIDTSPDTGGENFGVRPMQLVLMSLGGCSGIDIISILNKQRVMVQSFLMKIEGEREPDKIPSLWKTIHVIFEFEGKIEPAMAKRACELSIEKYCSVAETLRRAGAEISWKAIVNGFAV